MMKQRLFLCVLALFASTSLYAGTYKWVDKDGNVVYSQNPPPEGQYEAIRVKPAPRNSSTADDSNDRSKRYLEDVEAQRHNDAKLKTELKKAAALRKKNCTTAHKQLEFYTVYRRKKDKNGEYVRITDDERDAGIKEAKQAIQDFCD